MSNRRVPISDVLAMSPDERLQLVEDIWGTFEAAPEAVTLTDSQRQELDARIEAYHRDPKAGSPWHEVKARILRRLDQL